MPPWLGGGERAAKISRVWNNGDASKAAQGPWHPAPPTHKDLAVLGQPELWDAGVVLGKSLLPTPTRSLSEMFL